MPATGAVTLSVSLKNENAAFLAPNQWVNYTEGSSALALSDQICEGLGSDKEKYEAVRAYIKKNFVYDYIKALNISNGTMPDIEGCLSSHSGICQDLAALAACMLRVQGIPAKFVIGYIGKQYHAWVVVLLDGQEILFDPTADIGGVGRGSYSVERIY